jgi:hypothetical protein
VPDLDEPRHLRVALDDFHARVASRIVRPGAAAVHLTVRRRRNVRAAGAVAAMVAVVVGAVALLGGPVPPPDTGTPSETPATASTDRPSGSPSSPPSPGQSPTAAAPVSQAELATATVDLPAWSQRACPSGRFTFRGVSTRNGTATVTIGQIAHPDVDRDGAPETAAVLTCQGDAQVVLFDRGPAGAVTTVGQVVRTGNAVRAVFAVQANGSRVSVEVGDYRGCCGESADLPQHQWRVYAWTGQGFQQVDGPTSFPPNPNVADLSVSAGDLVWGPDNGGVQRGTVTVTVRNDGPGAPARATLAFALGGDTYLYQETLHELDGWQGCTVGSENTKATCPVTVPPAGQSRTLTFELRHGTVHGTGFSSTVRVSAALPDGSPAPDPDTGDNATTFVTK